MFNLIKRRINDMRMIKFISETAEQMADELGDAEPGAEHMVLAAILMPDGSGARVMSRFGHDLESVRQAIKDQYNDSLADIGIDPATLPDDLGKGPVEPRSPFYLGQPSMQVVFRKLSEEEGIFGKTPLTGARVLARATEIERGVIARIWMKLGIDPSALKAVALEEVVGSIGT